MKWYFALSEKSINRDDHAWVDLIWCAVDSAKKNTSLQPIMLYDGEPSTFTDQLQNLGVKIVYCRVPFYSALEIRAGNNSSYLAITSGCYLRTQIPRLEKDDKFVLYTDCDVIFRADPDVGDIQPAFFAAAPEGNREDYLNNMNTGVMVINCEAMLNTLNEFEEFIAKNLHIGLDQDHYRAFYAGKWDRLPNEFNWKPYWGDNKDAVIVHWHGPKPIWVKRYFGMLAKDISPIWKAMVEGSAGSYWRFLHEQIPYSRLPELSGRVSTVRVLVDEIEDAKIFGCVYNSAHPRSPIDVRILVDNHPVGAVHCDEINDSVRVFGHDGFVYDFSIQLDGVQSGSVVTFSDLEGKFISSSYKNHTTDGLVL